MKKIKCCFCNEVTTQGVEHHTTKKFLCVHCITSPLSGLICGIAGDIHTHGKPDEQKEDTPHGYFELTDAMTAPFPKETFTKKLGGSHERQP